MGIYFLYIVYTQLNEDTMSGDTFNFSSSNFSFSNFNYDNFDSSDSSNNCYIDDNGDLHEVSDTKDSYDNN